MSSTGLALPTDETVSKMRKKLTSTLTMLSSRNADSDQCAGAIDMWVAHLGNIAASSSFDGIDWLCKKLIAHANSLKPVSDVVIEFAEQLIAWLDEIQPEFHLLSDNSLIEKTLLILPELSRDELETTLGMTGGTAGPAEVNRVEIDGPVIESPELENSYLEMSELDNLEVDDFEVETFEVQSCEINSFEVDESEIDSSKVESPEVADFRSEEKNRYQITGPDNALDDDDLSDRVDVEKLEEQGYFVAKNQPEDELEVMVEEMLVDVGPLQQESSAWFQPMVQVVTNAYDSIGKAVGSASVSASSEEKFPEILEASLSAIGEIAMTAEFLEVEKLFSICDAANKKFTGCVSNELGMTRGEAQQLQQWITDLLNFVNDLDNNEKQKKVLSFALESRQETQLESISTELTNAEVTSINSEDTDEKVVSIESVCAENKGVAGLPYPENEEEIDWGEANEKMSQDDELLFEKSVADENDTENVDEVESILIVLRQELSEMSVELTSLLTQIIESEKNTNDKQKFVVQYITLVERLEETAEALGLTGLQQVCMFINGNFMRSTADNSIVPDDIAALFRDWPQQVLTYLNNPSQEDVCLALITYLQNNNWPESMADEDAHQIMVNLTREMDAEEIFGHEERVSRATPDDVSLLIPEDTNQDLLNAFFQESPDFAAEFSSSIERVAKGEGVTENIGIAQRLAHTLKGSANLIGAKGVANLTHHMEDILEFLSVNPGSFPAPLIVSLQEASDCVEVMVDSLQGKDAAPDDSLRILQTILDWANLIDAGKINEATDSMVATSPVASNKQVETDNETSKKLQSSYSAKEDSLHVPTRIIDDMFRMVGEMSISTSQIREYLKRLLRQGDDILMHDKVAQHKRFELEDMVDVRGFASVQRRMRNQGYKDENFDSLEMDQFDELHGFIHSFIETVSDSHEMTQRVQVDLTELDGMFLQQQRLNKELEQVVMTARMVPVNTISSRLQRCVRQASRATGKDVKLIISGIDLLLDSQVLTKLTDPIMHMLRNAVDHGIEIAEKRVTKGKPEIGQIQLEFLSDGNNIVVNCTDDGAGLDYERIRQAAINNGLLDEQSVIDNAQLARMILVSGFSTRQSATQISGRGVGMDIVHTAVQAFGGAMDVRDAKQCGCVVSLRVPISLVTSHTIVVRVADETVTVPSSALSRIVSIGEGRFKKLGDEITFQIDDVIYPTRSLAALIGIKEHVSISEYEKNITLLVRVDSGFVAVMVDQVLSSNELVVKSAGKYVRSVRGISGVSILGDGSVVPVLDLPELLRQPAANLSSQNRLTQSADDKNTMLNILIVDDSLSVRKSLSQLVEDAGFKSMVARDGVEAMDVINRQKPDLVLADLEMPRMTGLELTANIRANENFKNLPVIMITSRSTQKHRKQAERAGVSEYLTKPFSEDKLLSTINLLLSA